MDESSSDSEPPGQRQIYLTKMHGCGNDFIVIDELMANEPFSEDYKKWFYHLCNRNFGVGADQILLLERSEIADARMRILERDGSESDMCGNGVRCAALYLIERLGIQRPVTVETRAGLKTIEPCANLFKVNMGTPAFLGDRTYEVNGREIKASLINTGEPHIVIFVEDVESIDLVELARHIRYGDEFLKEGVNVNVVQVVGDGKVKIRTYERGVEGETLSCGTGSTACGVTAAIKLSISMPVGIETRGGNLLIDYNGANAFLMGPAEFVFDCITNVQTSAMHRPMLEIRTNLK